MISLEEKKLRQALVRGAELMMENGLGDWKVSLQNKRTALADCNKRAKTIRYSKHFLRVAEKEQFEGVTLHEIAHALVPAHVGHGAEFVEKCIEISPNADYAKRSVKIFVFKYTMTCPECGVTGGVNRKRTGTCARCLRDRNKEVDFVLTENKPTIKLWSAATP